MAANVITALNLRIGFNVSEFETAQRTIRQSTARSQQILKSMEGPMEKFANDIAAITVAAEEEGWSQEKLLSVYDHLDKQYDVTGKYARQTARAKEELAAIAKQEASDVKLLTGLLAKAPTEADKYEEAIAALNRQFQKGSMTLAEYKKKKEELTNILVTAPRQAREAAEAARQEAEAQKKLSQQLAQSRAVRQRVVALSEQAGVGLSKLAKEQQYYNKALQQGLIDEREHARALQLLNKIYVEAPALAKAAADAEKRKADAAKAAAESAKKAAADEAEAQKRVAQELAKSREIRQRIVGLAEQAGVGISKLAKEQAYYNKALQQGRISEAEHARAMQLLNKIYVETPALVKAAADAEKKRAEAAREAAEAAKKLADEEAAAQKRIAEQLAKSRSIRESIAALAEQAGLGLSEQAKKQAYYNKALQDGLIDEREHARALQLVNKVYVEAPALAKAAADAERRKTEQAKAAADAARELANEMKKQEKAIATAYIADELKKIEEAERKVADAIQFATSVIERADTATGSYEKEINRLFADLQAGNITLEKYQEALAAIDEHYIDAPARIKAERDAQEQLNNAHKVASKFITQEGTTAEQQYRVVHRALITLRNAKKLTNEEYIKARDAAYREIVMNKRVADSVARLEKMEKLKAEAHARAAKEANKEAQATGQLAGTIRNLAGAYIGFQTVRAGAKIGSDIEQATVAFEVMAGSAKEGAKVLEGIRSFAARTPITFEGAQKAGKLLMQFGVENEKVVQSLEMLGDISAGDTQRLEGLALAYGQVAAAGRLTGQETNQMINHGFNPLKQIAEDMAKEFGGLADDYFPNLKKQMEQGNLPFDLVRMSMESATTEGGRFAGMMDKMGKTTGGAFNKLLGMAQRLIAVLWERLSPVLTSILNNLANMTSWVSQLAESWNGLGGELMIAAGAGVAVMGMIIKIIGVINLMRKATAALNVVLVIRNALSGPKGWAILAAGAVAAAGALVAMKMATKESEEALEKETEVVKRNSEYVKAMKKLRAGIRPVASTKDTESFNEQMKKMRAEFELLGLNKEQLRIKEKQMFIDKVWAMNIMPGYKQDLLTQYERNKAKQEEASLQELLNNRLISAATTERQVRDLQAQGLITNVEMQEKLLALEDKRLEKVKQLADAGRSIQEKYNPVAKVAEQLAELNVLLATGNITQEQFFKERNDMLKKSLSVGDMGPVEAQKRGSQELASFLAGEQADVQQRQLEEAMAQKLLQEAQLQAQQETNRKLGELQPVGVIRK